MYIGIPDLDQTCGPAGHTVSTQGVSEGDFAERVHACSSVPQLEDPAEERDYVFGAFSSLSGSDLLVEETTARDSKEVAFLLPPLSQLMGAV